MSSTAPGSVARRFGIFTNASAKDAPRLAVVIPHWLRQFSPCLDEIFILLDPRVPEGRISRQHSIPSDILKVERLLDDLAGRDRRVRWSRLDYARLPDVSRRWWTHGQPVRCQDGTPVFAFAAGFESMRGRFVLRSDCDMLFRDDGWVQAGLAALSSGQYDMISPPRLGAVSRLSSRALLFDGEAFPRRFLPMPAARLDWARRLYRRWRGRAPWLAFEDSLGNLVATGKAKFAVLPSALGASMHVARVGEFVEPGFPFVAEQWEKGLVPARQREHGWDYLAAAWSHAGVDVAGKQG